MEVENRYIAITKRYIAECRPSESDLELRSSRLTLTVDGGSKDVIVKNLYVSVDPYQINRMKEWSPSHQSLGVAARIEPGQRIEAFGAGRVVATGNEEFEKGDLVAGQLGWEDYTIVKPGGMLMKIDSMEFPLSYHVGILGPVGFTAYIGFYEVCKPKKGEKVFVSAAAGSVGSLVGQFAKLEGCYVVGCAGSEQKVELLKEELGLDDAFNYKEEKDLMSTLRRYFPKGIDIYFDNVGGEMLEAAVASMNAFGRVAACGVISEYTEGGRQAALDMINIIYKRITVRGFLVLDHMAMYNDFVGLVSDHLRHSRLNVVEDISQGLESVPSAFVGLFRGDNVGKKLVQLADV